MKLTVPQIRLMMLLGLFVLMRLSTISADETPSRRIALVVGNSAYGHLPRVGPAGPDAEAVGRALQELKFDTRVRKDLKNEEMRVVRDQFLQEIRPGDTAAFFFSGYSIPFQQGDNYLLPADFDPSNAAQWEDDVQMSRKASSLAYFMEQLEKRGAGVKILMIDGSRTAPALARGGEGFSSESDRRPQTFLLISAEPGKTSMEDASKDSSLFATALLEVLLRPGLTLAQVQEHVFQRVYRESGGTQSPVALVSLVTTPFVLRPAEVEAAKPVVPVEIARPTPASTVLAAGAVAINRDREEYVLIPAGQFLMGCVPASAALCEPQERPQHEVVITQPFWLGRNEVQVERYRNFTESTRKKMPKPPQGNPRWRNSNYPMVDVSWQEASDYCQWAGGRLPSEAEWEYAYRAGESNRVYALEGEDSRDKANFYGRKGNDRYDEWAPVKSFDPNAFGLFDMAGNVWEWVGDYMPPFTTGSSKTDMRGPATGTTHFIRGGSYNSDPKKHLRLSYRKPGEGPGNNIGFRCLLPDSPAIRLQFRR